MLLPKLAAPCPGPFPGIALAGLALLIPGALRAQGSLMVNPHRLVLEDAASGKHPAGGRGRAAEVLLINGGKEPATFRISFRNMEMNEDGGLVEQPKAAGKLAAEDLVRFAPRQVVLEPGASQTVRIQVRKPANLPAGEYRSHMMFRQVPMVAKAPDPANPEPPAETTFSMTIRPIYGISIPVIIRHGATHVQVRLADLALDPPAKPGGAPALRLNLLREGNRSVLGNLKATWTPRQGPATLAGEFRNLAIYANVPRRRLSLDLPGLSGKGRGAGTLKVEFQDNETRKLAAEAVLELPDDPAPGP